MWERFKTWFLGAPKCAWCSGRLKFFDAAFTHAGKPVFDSDDDDQPIHRACFEASRAIDALILESDNSRYSFAKPPRLALVSSRKPDPPRPPPPEKGRE